LVGIAAILSRTCFEGRVGGGVTEALTLLFLLGPDFVEDAEACLFNAGYSTTLPSPALLIALPSTATALTGTFFGIEMDNFPLFPDAIDRVDLLLVRTGAPPT
jgi:hypothetical protein